MLQSILLRCDGIQKGNVGRNENGCTTPTLMPTTNGHYIWWDAGARKSNGTSDYYTA